MRTNTTRVPSAGDTQSQPERKKKQLKVSNRLSTCHQTKQVLHMKLSVRILLSTSNSHPLTYISSGLFCGCKCHLRCHKATKRSCAAEKTKEKSSKENPLRSFESGEPMRRGPRTGYRWRGRRTRGEINSARPYLAAAPCWVSAEHAVLGKSPFLPLSVTPCPLRSRNLSEGLLKVIP